MAAPGARSFGTAGVVHFKVETRDGGGTVTLMRGDQSEPLFDGGWVHIDQARAPEHRHAFEEQ